MFRPVNAKVEFPKLEEHILQFWKESAIFEKSVKNRLNSGRQFILYEGPPTANGRPGIHHVLSRVFKDVIPRYKTMKGYYAPRKAGWDTHGLPVELEIEKKLGFTSKSDIERYGIEKFNTLCRESVFTYLKEWNALTERIGYWLDVEHPYVTLENNYIESVWWALKQLSDKNLIYQGYKVTPHCPRCGTSLSWHEVALGYKDNTEDPSVYIKFKFDIDAPGQNKKLLKFLKDSKVSKPVYFLAWTTTPWTLPGNTSLAVSAESEYTLLEGDDDCLIMASALIERVGLDGFKPIGTIKGEDLEGSMYEPLFNPHDYGVERRAFDVVSADRSFGRSFKISAQPADPCLRYPVIATDFVSMEDGTGIVHIAPAFGEVDFDAGREKGLNFVQPVDLEGKMIGNYKFAGKFVKDADPMVLEDLKSRGLLFKAEKIYHTYPFCWRCDEPVVYYAKKTWYIKTTEKKNEMIEGNKKINWYPDYIKYGRFGDWLQNNVDWAFSRERYWGTPLNIWRCGNCNEYESVGSLAELKSKTGIKGITEPVDLHRPFVDGITYSCTHCGGEKKRETEVIDCWFDSGAMPFAQWHYPFENQDIFKDRFPADYISEAVDQTRGWFYSLHAISTMLMGEPCYKNVICLGHVLDAKGDKMSKTKGNVVEPSTVLNKFGADAVRWYLLTASPPGNVRRFSSELISEIQRNFLLTLWNTYSFFVMYANIDNINPLNLKVTPADLDIWILSHLNKLVRDVDSLLENYDPTAAGRKIEVFVDDLSNWYIRRSRRRFWKSQNDSDKMSAYYTLYNCLTTLAKLLAPLAPFIAEELYQNLVKSVDASAPESVHLCDFPIADPSLIDETLIEQVKAVISVCSIGRAARAKAGIKVRQPLAKVLINAKSQQQKNGIAKLKHQIMEELNVKEVEYVEQPIENEAYSVITEGDFWVAVDTKLTPDLQGEGIAREIVRRLQVMRRSSGLEIADHIIVYYQGGDEIAKIMSEFGDYISQETLANQIVADSIGEGIFSEKHRILSSQLVLGIKKAAS